MAFKMKGHTLPGIKQRKGSAFPDKPTKAEIIDAANNKNNPMHPDNQGVENYLAWKSGSKIRSTTFHGAGGDIKRDDAVVGNILEE